MNFMLTAMSATEHLQLVKLFKLMSLMNLFDVVQIVLKKEKISPPGRDQKVNEMTKTELKEK